MEKFLILILTNLIKIKKESFKFGHFNLFLG